MPLYLIIEAIKKPRDAISQKLQNITSMLPKTDNDNTNKTHRIMMWLIMKFWGSKIDVFISLKLVMIPSLTFVSRFRKMQMPNKKAIINKPNKNLIR